MYGTQCIYIIELERREREFEEERLRQVRIDSSYMEQVAKAQGKQEIWMLSFPDRENTGNLVNLILAQGKLWQHRENCVLVVESLACNVISE